MRRPRTHRGLAPHAAHAHHAASHKGQGIPTIAEFLEDPNRPWEALSSFAHHLLAGLLAALPWLALAALAALLAFWLLRQARERRLAGEDGRLLEIGVPPDVDPARARLLWLGLHDLLRPRLSRLLSGQPHLSWEIGATQARGTVFRVWSPRTVPPGLLERALASAWPGASVTEAAEQDEEPTGHLEHAACELSLSGPEWFPLGGCEGPDPLALVLGQLTDLDSDERVLVQVLARPVSTREQRRLEATARRLRAGIPTSRVLRALEFFKSRQTPRTSDPTLSPDVRAVLEKAAEPLYRCRVRIVVDAPKAKVARGRIHAVAGAFAAYEGRAGLRRRRVFGALGKAERRHLGRRAYLLSVSELAALCHLPGESALPGLLRSGARAVSPPPGLAQEGKPLGRAPRGGEVSLAVSDARHHVHILGPNGVGKSTLIARMALSDLHGRRGAVVIDPKGDLVQEILARVPEGLEEMVDVLDPLDPAPPGLNVLRGQNHELTVDQIVSIFHRVYEQFWGPRTDDILRSSLYTLIAAGGEEATLADVPRLLTDAQWRGELKEGAEEQLGVPEFWEWYEGLGEAARAQASGPVLNKLRAFLMRSSVAAIIGQADTTLDIAGCLDRGRLLLCRLPKGLLGEDTARLIGSFVIARVWQAALTRSDRPEAWRPDCALYVDEVHSFMTLPNALDAMLAEARGYRLSICLAHQHLGQLRRELRDAVASEARTKVYFQLAPEDARALEVRVSPELSAHDLVHLERYHAAVCVCRGGGTTPAFTIATAALGAGSDERAEQVREASRTRIGKPRTEVLERLRRRGAETTSERGDERGGRPDHEGGAAA